ncbi:hypothetical protein Nmel_001177 [Mimus melanotis]
MCILTGYYKHSQCIPVFIIMLCYTVGVSTRLSCSHLPSGR